jgi:hypothetical protein
MRIRGGFADLNPAGFFDNCITLQDPAGARICRATRQASQPPPPSLETVRAAEAELLARRKLQSERTTGTQAGERASFAEKARTSADRDRRPWRPSEGSFKEGV